MVDHLFRSYRVHWVVCYIERYTCAVSGGSPSWSYGSMDLSQAERAGMVQHGKEKASG